MLGIIQYLIKIFGIPASTSPNSVAATGSAVALSTTPTAFTGGIDLLNTDASTAVFIGAAPTAAAGTGVFCLGPGQGYCWPAGDASVIKIISTGTPIVSWMGKTL